MQIKPNNIHRKFAVHEDLLCATSKLFRNRLQKHRKLNEGERSICHEELNAIKADITFCRSKCGQNYHQHCLEDWKNSPLDGGVTCPLCRHDRTPEPTAVLALPGPNDFEPETLQTYIDWLYTGTIQVDPKIPPESDEFNVYLLKAMSLACTVADEEFASSLKAHLVAHFESKVNTGFRKASIEYAFGAESYIPVKHFVLWSALSNMSGRQVFSGMDQLSDAVVQAIDDSLMQLRRYWFMTTTSGEYELVDAEE